MLRVLNPLKLYFHARLMQGIDSEIIPRNVQLGFNARRGRILRQWGRKQWRDVCSFTSSLSSEELSALSPITDVTVSFYPYRSDESSSPVSEEAINTWFDTYVVQFCAFTACTHLVDEEEDVETIGEEGILKFCEDIGVDPQDIVVLVIGWKMGAAYMCEFTRKEWKSGMEAMGVDSIDKLKAQVPSLREEISSDAKFKKFYSFCFGFSKEPGQKSLGIDIAVPMWELLLSTRFEKLTAEWLAFLEEKKPCKGVTRDTWDLLLDFFGKVHESYDNYDENEAWPVLIDDYMTWIESKKL